MPNSLSIKIGGTTGRWLVFVGEASEFKTLLESLFYTPSDSIGKYRIAAVFTPRVSDSNWIELTSSLLEILKEHKIRQGTFIGLGAASILVQNLALLELKLVRTAVFLNATTQPHPSLLIRLTTHLERWLPLGLPLRGSVAGFDGRSFLHRIRCPVLLVSSLGASGYEKEQAELLARQLPTAWHTVLERNGTGTGREDALRLIELVANFQDTPARCPQKSRQANSPRGEVSEGMSPILE